MESNNENQATITESFNNNNNVTQQNDVSTILMINSHI